MSGTSSEVRHSPARTVTTQSHRLITGEEHWLKPHRTFQPELGYFGSDVGEGLAVKDGKINYADNALLRPLSPEVRLSIQT